MIILYCFTYKIELLLRKKFINENDFVPQKLLCFDNMESGRWCSFIACSVLVTFTPKWLYFSNIPMI